ncbi:unnamed protein product [Calypogeia fissa]
MVVAMVGASFRHSAAGGLSSRADGQPSYFHCADYNSSHHHHPSPSYRREDASSARALLLPSPAVAKSKLEIGLSRKESQFRRQFRRIRESKEIQAWVLEISVLGAAGRRGERNTAHAARPTKQKLVGKVLEVSTRAVGEGEFERGSEETILTKSRKEEDEEEDGAGTKPGEEGDSGGDIATISEEASPAAEMSKEGLNEEKSEGSGEMGWNSTESRTSTFTSAEDDRFVRLLDDRFLRRVAMADNADAVLALIAEMVPEEKGGVLTIEDCSQIILAAIGQNNVELAFSILDSMRSSLLQRRIDRQEDANGEKGRNWGWGWPQPDVTTYAVLARGLAASLRVSDAVRIVGDVRRRGVPQGDEVPFGKVVTCPTCKTSLAVVQPQHGIQLVPCGTCRYQYELMSGVIVNSESESISSDTSFWERALQVLPFLNRRIPAAVHSIVVRAPDGLAQTHRFATQSADVPAQEGERVTMVLASPANVGRGIGPIRFNARAPGWKPREPMAVTNHITGLVLNLLRAPPKPGSKAAFDTNVILPVAILLASTDVASGLIDPSLPRLVAVGAAAAFTVNTLVLPRLNQLPQRTVDAIALRQRLLAQYEQLQARLQELTEAASNEVRMLARMCQLQNKMEAVGEASYGARIDRVRKAREGLGERIAARLELLDSYAKVASMIEIEVEMDIDVLAAEAASPEATIAEQIERLMEVENLQKEWKNQAEANDELERLLRTAPFVPDSA